MRKLLLTLLLISSLIGFSQSENPEIKIDSVSFKAKIDLKKATKDGIYLNGYVVNIPYKELKKLDGKTIEINGIITIRKGLKNIPKQQNDNGNEIVSQGRNEDMKHIEKPKYRIIKE